MLLDKLKEWFRARGVRYFLDFSTVHVERAPLHVGDYMDIQMWQIPGKGEFMFVHPHGDGKGGCYVYLRCANPEKEVLARLNG